MGLNSLSGAHPVLKRWAKLCCAYGATAIAYAVAFAAA